MNIPATVIAWVALAVSIIAGIFAFTAGRGGGEGAAAIEKQVADLAAKVEAVKPFDPAPLQAKLDELATRIEAAQPFDPAPLEAKVTELEEKVAAAPASNAFDPAPIQARIEELGKKVAEMPAPEPFDPTPLRNQLDELGQKLAAIEGFDAAAFQARVDELGKKIAEMPAPEPFDPAPLQKQLDALSAAVASKEGGGGGSVGKQRLLGQVFFDTNSSRLTDDARSKLDGWIGELSGKPHRLAILGFSDSVGRAQYNVALSIRRAAAVRSYLLRGGLSEGSVVVSAGGYGEEGAPVATDDNVDEPQNRTVHVYVYE